jgi:hypothetical protein
MTISLSTIVILTTQAQDVANPNGIVQVYDVASVSKLDQNKYDQFTFENDTVIINYMFWASRGKMQVKIENKLSVPIYINWSQSTYTIEGVEIPMSPYVEKLNDKEFKIYEKYKAMDPTLTDMDYEWKKQTHTGQQKKEKDQIIEILSKSTYTKGNYYLAPAGGLILDTNAACIVDKHSTIKNQKAFIYVKEYNQSDSPIKFSCKLIVSTDKSFTSKYSTYVQQFYVSKISEMDAKHFRGKKVSQTPEGYIIYKFPERKSSRFYVEIDRRNSVDFNKGVRRTR